MANFITLGVGQKCGVVRSIVPLNDRNGNCHIHLDVCEGGRKYLLDLKGRIQKGLVLRPGQVICANYRVDQFWSEKRKCTMTSNNIMGISVMDMAK